MTTNFEQNYRDATNALLAAINSSQVASFQEALFYARKAEIYAHLKCEVELAIVLQESIIHTAKSMGYHQKLVGIVVKGVEPHGDS